MNFKKWIVGTALLCGLLITNLRSAEPVENDFSRLENLLAHAALNNPGLEAAFNQWRAAEAKISQAKSLPDPKFNYSYFIREVETRVGPQKQRFGISQTLPWFGNRRLAGEVASEEANGAKQAYQAAKRKLFYQTKDAYFEYYYLKQSIAITEENIQLLKNLETVAQAALRGGASLSSVTQTQLELSKLEDRLLSLQDMRGPISARLNATLNRAPDAPLPWPVPVFSDEVKVDEKELYAVLAHRNPELRGLEFNIAREEHSIDLARRESYPDFTFGVDYIQTDEARMPGVSDSGKDPLIAMVSITIPLWRGKYRAAVDSAYARRDAAEDTRENRVNWLRSELQFAMYQFRDAERKISLYRDTLIPQARSALSVAEQSYEAGKADFLNLIDAQRVLLNFQLEYERARASREQRLAEIEMLTGEELPQHPGLIEEADFTESHFE